MARALTGFGAGTTADEAFRQAGLPSDVTHAQAVAVPEGANPSKVGTYVQRVALDPNALEEVPAELQDLVETAAMHLRGDRTLALAVDMGGTPAGDKMLARLSPATPDARPWLVMAIADE